jgi:hypothetical protein
MFYEYHMNVTLWNDCPAGHSSFEKTMSIMENRGCAKGTGLNYSTGKRIYKAYLKRKISHGDVLV